MPGLNNTFCGAEPTWANACVGNNGNPGYWTYAKGFSQAANLLIQAVLSDRAHHLLVDEYIYPVCFNMRHSVELCLKGVIAQIQEISQVRGNPLEFNLAESHDINLIWGFIVTKSSQLDERYLPIIQKIDSVIKDLGEVDPTGQTFRYPVSSESEKHLTDVSVINFINLSKAFKFLESQLDILHHFGTFLIDEYGFNTITRNLSRYQIWKLANDLPSIEKWHDALFDKVRHSLKDKYKLSGNELSKAINLIKTHYEFAPLIGEKLPLLGLEIIYLTLFLDHSLRLYKIKPDTLDLELSFEDGSSAFDGLLKRLERDAEIIAQAWDEFEPIINPEILAGLKALFYFARYLNFSEEYIALYGYELKDARVLFKRSVDDVRQSFAHLLEKTNAVHNILQSLYFLSQCDLAEKFVRRYELEEKFSWLGKARSYRLFKKPSYCGYTT